MKALITAAAAGVAGLLAVSSVWSQGNDRVAFPENYSRGVHYATVERGNIREELFVGRDVIEAAKKGQAIPNGAVITMEDYRGGKLFRYVVMEKRAGWGERYAETQRNGDWEFQSFQPDRTINRSENVARCMACHRGQDQNDFVFTLDRMKSASVSRAEEWTRLAQLGHSSSSELSEVELSSLFSNLPNRTSLR